MRTPNTKCCICENLLYRRPSDLKKVRLVCCRGCRGKAYKKYPNKKALKCLDLGREKGTNHLQGIPKSKDSNTKRSKSHKKWCKENPDKVKARGVKCRAEKHYNWKGGSSRLNISIRAMTENRKWMDAIKERDRECEVCETTKTLESHHIISLAVLINSHGIKNRDDARKCVKLWDLNNGRTLCQKHHYKLHGRKYDNARRKAI